jgi:hypothetical protein
MKVEVTFKLVYSVEPEHYSPGMTTFEMVAADFEEGVLVQTDQNIYLINVQPYTEDKNEVALEAELMSKTLGLDNG